MVAAGIACTYMRNLLCNKVIKSLAAFVSEALDVILRAAPVQIIFVQFQFKYQLCIYNFVSSP